MNYYELSAAYDPGTEIAETEEEKPFGPGRNREHGKRSFKNLCQEINGQLNTDTERKTSVYAYHAAEGTIKFIYEADADEIRKGKVKKDILKVLRDRFGQIDIKISKPKEITCETYYRTGNQAERYDFIDHFNDYDLDVFANRRPYVVKESLIPEKACSITQLLKEADECLADNSFLEEIERICSADNLKKYCGNPVHYLLTVTNRDSANDMITLLGKALHANKRLLGRRITRVSEIEEGCYDEDDFEKMIERSDGNIVVFELDGSYEDHGNYANAYNRVIMYLDRLFKKYQRNTLCVFVKNLECPGFADLLVSRVAEEARIIEIKEGGGNRERIISYVKRLAQKDGQPVIEDEVKKLLDDRKYYKVGEAHDIYSRYFCNSLMYNAYKAYRTCVCVDGSKKKGDSEPYEELQKLIGLTEIKKVVDSVISNARIQKIRSSKGMDTYKTSLHMVYTGNPGSAKTTVARLLGQILARESIIDKADIVECGRADLVGRYVGWTAKEVRSKFRQARGGILFIDEAYSLVDDSKTFGDEAINTIVQEMENNRDDVIVIFAGYPDKMKEFLDRNEGLRSRIAYHLDFPDYDQGELVRILEKMADEKGFVLDEGVRERCEEIFGAAVKHKDYGNGRFVRNLLEQAMMAQSERLAGSLKGKKLSRKALTTLLPEDFDVNTGRKYSDKKKIGFAV